MTHPEMNRRDFTRWTAAAFGGVVAGSIAGCAGEPDAPVPPAGEGGEGAPSGEGGAMDAEGSGTAATPAEGTPDVAYLLEEPHVCRGLNTCEGKGASGDNACAGQGTCHNANKHTCHYENECKGQGGCGKNPGQNACKGKGECAVPLSKPSWESARAAFEKAMEAAGKQVGAAPAES